VSRDIFTIRTVWERRDGLAWMQPTTQFFGEEPYTEDFYPLDDETRDMSDEDVAKIVLQGVMVGVFLLERSLPVRYVPPEDFEKLTGEQT
jgi:hypothetical protein